MVSQWVHRKVWTSQNSGRVVGDCVWASFVCVSVCVHAVLVSSCLTILVSILASASHAAPKSKDS
jgi:hypothetical protein